MTEEKVEEILVFKTNLVHRQDVSSIAVLLDRQSGIYRWNVDMHDCDRVLRVVVDPSLKPGSIIRLLKRVGYVCEELL